MKASEAVEEAKAEGRHVDPRPAGSTEVSEEERPIVDDLRAIGVEVTGVHQIRNKADQYPGMRDVLFEHLSRGDYSDNVRAAMAGALGGKKIGSGFARLVELYRSEAVGHVKEQYADSIARCGPEHLEDVIELIRDQALGRSRVQLVKGLTRSKKPEAKQTLRDLRNDPDLKVEIGRRLKD
jgi:hypothetical protein